MPMSRAEAICACHNIVELIEQMDEKLPDSFSSSVDDKAKSMLNYILSTPQYPRVTEKMDQALRNMWSGLQKWNRNGDFNDNLFDGLEGVMKELQAIQNTFDGTPNEESSNDTDDSAIGADGYVPKEGPVGIEDFDMSKDPRFADKAPITTGTQTGRFQVTGPNKANEPKKETTLTEDLVKLASQVTGLTPEQIVKTRENAISAVLNQIHEKHISVVDTKHIRHGILQEVLKLTKSDRTTQLIYAAFYAGKIAGIMQLGEDLSTEAGKK